MWEGKSTPLEMSPGYSLEPVKMLHLITKRFTYVIKVMSLKYTILDYACVPSLRADNLGLLEADRCRKRERWRDFTWEMDLTCQSWFRDVGAMFKGGVRLPRAKAGPWYMVSKDTVTSIPLTTGLIK